MRDNFELVEFSLYVTACGLLLPLVGIIGRDNIWSMIVILALFIPIPVYVARLRTTLPYRLDLALEKYAYGMFGLGLLSMVVVLLCRALAW